MARARSPSTTIPSSVTSGGGAGAGGAAATGAGGGAGGRRSGEKSGRSRAADRRSSDSVCKGLPRMPARWSWDCAFALVGKIEANPSTRTEMLGNDSECVTASPFAKKAQAQVVRKCGSSLRKRKRLMSIHSAACTDSALEFSDYRAVVRLLRGNKANRVRE